MKKLINKYGWLLQDLNEDEKQILGGGVLMVFGFVFLTWLTSTAVTHKTAQVTQDVTQDVTEQNYELPQSYNKYANRIYNEKYGK